MLPDFKLLGRLKQIKNKIISTHQIEMEFQKNRQGRISESFKKLKLLPGYDIPGLFVGTKESKELDSALKLVKKHLEGLQNSLSAAMRDPAADDPVYRATKRSSL